LCFFVKYALKGKEEARMSRIAIVTDSSAYLPPELITRYGIHVMPLYVHFGEETFRDGVDLRAAAFYEKLKRAKILPTTSQPSAGDFMALYRRLVQQVDAVVSIHVTSKLSGTVASALAARKALQAEAAERGDPHPEIHVVDSLLATGALGLLVTAMARMAEDAGSSAQKMVRSAEALIPRMTVAFVVDTLEYLRKGGRIGGAAALLGSLIQIRPILHLDRGRIDVLEKVRTAKKAMRRLMRIMEERMGRGAPVHAAILHANRPDEAEELRQKVAGRLDCSELIVCELSPAIGAHVGPGAVGLAYYQ
jgi:DegV family protein with EDD domain